MGHALDANTRDGGAGERGEQNAAQRVAEGVAETAIEGLDREGAAVLLHRLACDPGELEVEHESLDVVLVSHRRAETPALEVRSPAAGHRTGHFLYFEYSSTMSCSCTGAATSRRSACAAPWPRATRDRPAATRNLSGGLSGVSNRPGGALFRLDRDHVARAHLIAGMLTRRPLTIQWPWRITGVTGDARPQSPAAPARCESALQQGEQVLTGDAGLAGSLHVVAVELLLQYAVVAARLLLLAQLHRYSLCFMRPRPCSPAGRRDAPRHTCRQTTLALEEQVLSLTAALLALRLYSSH